MITKITSRPIPFMLSILSAICACVLLNGRITPSGKYELMANLGFGLYQNLANKNIKWIKKDKIVGARFQSADGTEELFVGLQKGPFSKAEQNTDLSQCAKAQSVRSAHDNQLNYKVSINGLHIRMKMFLYSQEKTNELLNNTERDHRITNLNYVNKKCSIDKIVLLNQNNSNVPQKEEKTIFRFGLLIQILNK